MTNGAKSRALETEALIGSVIRRVPLAGRFETESGPAAAELCLTNRGLWLVTPETPVAQAIELSLGTPGTEEQGRPFAYEVGRANDRLRVSASVLGIHAGKRGRARELVALARLRCQSPELRETVVPSRPTRLLRDLDAVARAYLEHRLARDEALLAWALGGRTRVMASALAGNAVARIFWLVTDRQSTLVSLGILGDVEEQTVSAEARLEKGFLVTGTEAARDGKFWEGSTEVGQQLLALTRLEGALRITRAAKIEWHARVSSKGWVDHLLRRAEARDSEAFFARELVATDAKLRAPSRELTQGIAMLASSEASPDALARHWEDWSKTPASAAALVAKLRAVGSVSEPWAFELHTRALEQRTRPEPEQRFDLARHALAARRFGEAERSVRPELLPSDAEIDLALAAAAPQPNRAELIAANQIALEARLSGGGEVAEVLYALCRLSPLSPEAIDAVMAGGLDTLRERVGRLRDLLAPEGLGSSSSLPTAALEASTSRALDSELFERVLHPATRALTRVAAVVQGALATSDAANPDALKAWCERLRPEQYPEVVAAAERATTLLGLPAPELYVSRGNRSLGVRALAGRAPILVLGGEHLDPGSAHALGAGEFCFLIGSELARVRFGYDRATAREVWFGALDKARVGLEVALTALPIAKGMELGGRAARALERVPAHGLERAARAVTALQTRMSRLTDTKSELSQRHEQLVPSQRKHELTLDRVGLVAAVDLGAAIRSLFATRSDHCRLLSEVNARGLHAAAKGVLRDSPELLLRIEALSSFYLSQDYELLLRASSR